VYLDPNEEIIGDLMKSAGVRFHKTKARSAAKMMSDFWPHTSGKIRSLINESDLIQTRNFLAKKIKGWGLKEASHFLRNVGYGEHIAILDRHILRRLVDQSVILEIPKMLDTQTYLEIEQKMIQFGRDIDVPMEALDLLFWYQSKGEFFK
jgi:N-glycosylase/DNA lyase